jgi:Tat protein secretion system quality control protein TatD with DNase activity
MIIKRRLGSQLVLAKKYHLPLFLHSRAAHTDFVKILREEGFGEDGGKGVGAKGGVVHSFTGNSEEVEELVSILLHPSKNHPNQGKDQHGVLRRSQRMFHEDRAKSRNIKDHSLG